jgi:2-phospho-L-lactate/phosphoenolpyruvate guanylyltransferase
MSTVAVLPVKRFAGAKRRLGEGLSSPARRMLAEAMVSDVLIALRRARRVEDVVVVTGESAAEAIARGHGAAVVYDPDDAGQVPAALRGVEWAIEHDAARVLLVPGDCPALDPLEVDRLLATAGAAGPEVVIVPDRHGTGTNALVLTPPDAIAPSFGPGSRARHEQAAQAAGAAVRVTEPPSLVLDVDTADDLAALQSALAGRTGGAGFTRGLLARLGRAAKPAPPGT